MNAEHVQISRGGKAGFAAEWPTYDGDLSGAVLTVDYKVNGTAGNRVLTWTIRLTKPGTATRWVLKTHSYWWPNHDGQMDWSHHVAIGGKRGWEGATEGNSPRTLTAPTLRWATPLIERIVNVAHPDLVRWLEDPVTDVTAVVAEADRVLKARANAVDAAERDLETKRRRLAEGKAALEAAMAAYRAVGAEG